MKRLVGQWVRKAEADFGAAEVLWPKRRGRYDVLCFLYQQTVEKYLKARLVDLRLPAQRTHHLEDLLNRLLTHDPHLQGIRRGARFLTQFAVEYRYPGYSAHARKAAGARRWATRIRAILRSMLGLPV